MNDYHTPCLGLLWNPRNRNGERYADCSCTPLLKLDFDSVTETSEIRYINDLAQIILNQSSHLCS